MKQVQRDLTKKLLEQGAPYSAGKLTSQLESCKRIAQTFVGLENGIAILSDLKNNRSHIYTGKLAMQLGVFKNSMESEIETIWERELFDQLNPEDVLRKHQLELHFFQFVQHIPPPKRRDYCVVSRLRIIPDHHLQSVLHKMFYFFDGDDGSPELALCLYSLDLFPSGGYSGMIVNTADGTVLHRSELECLSGLSFREKEILKLVQVGKISKEIAEQLCISINTVNRHRQNILKKMSVGNITQACALAANLKWI